MDSSIFEDLFVLELANNHWGSLDKGKKIISEFSNIIRDMKIKAAVKLQFREGINFVHKDFRKRSDILYIKKVMNSIMSIEQYSELVNEIRKNNIITMSTPFDEKSVETCKILDIDIIKIASANIKEKYIIELTGKLRKPVIVSTGGASLEDIDKIVDYFEGLNIPLAINHCISKYPTEKKELELNEIDFLKKRYKEHVIGFSTHELNSDIEIPMYIAYAKGARTFERHIDIKWGNNEPFKYCSTTKDIIKWVNAYKKAKEICGSSCDFLRKCDNNEENYINSIHRGVYASADIKEGEELNFENTYFAIPLLEGQISSQEFESGVITYCEIKKDSKVDKAYIKSKEPII